MDRHRKNQERRIRRKKTVRKRVFGTAEKPRLSVSRSLRNIDAQLINDESGETLCAAGSRNKDLRERIGDGGNKIAAKSIGTILAERAKAKGISQVAFDRNGFRYHGRIKALAEGAREGGLKF